MSSTSRSGWIIFGIVAVILASCGEPSGSDTTAFESTTTTTETTTTSNAGTMPTVPTSNPNTAPDSVVDKAIEDLATKLGTSPDAITVVLAEEKTWNDGSIGCPEPGMSYTQALVDGSRVMLEADGRLYDYHAGSDGEPFLCESEQKDGGYDFVPPPGFDE
ncbi:MAG: hypothetical protein DWQ40_10080 [Actinobacteria bacterium]|nr:MAG: hypothetical protein DWQ40_10080 [Actinomycetota bacterium]